MPRVVRQVFTQQEKGGAVSRYVCSWQQRPALCGSARAVERYLRHCFSNPEAVSRQFVSSKIRCHSLAAKFRVLPLAARRFARESEVLCSLDLRTGRSFYLRGLRPSAICPPNPMSHREIQAWLSRREGFVASEVPLYSDILTGHLDCLMVDDQEDYLYCVEVKSYPSDIRRPYLCSSRSKVFSSLVQSLSYAELLHLRIGVERLAVAIVHASGCIALDARAWLRGGRTLLSIVRGQIG